MHIPWLRAHASVEELKRSWNSLKRVPLEKRLQNFTKIDHEECQCMRIVTTLPQAKQF